MKLRPSPFKMLMIIMILGVVSAVLSFVFSIDFSGKTPVTIQNLILPIILVSLSIAFSIYSYIRAYYILDNKGITQQLLFKKKFFPYNEIAYIDDIRSRRTKTLVFYLTNGRQVMLAMDNSCKMLFEVSERCPNLSSRSDFLKKHPNVVL